MITFEAVTKTYGAGGETAAHALAGIDLTIEAGTVFGVIGASGAGKSTLLRLINALERPTSGAVLVKGERVDTLKGRDLRQMRRRIGMIFQHFNLMQAKTVRANVALPLEFAGELSPSAIADRVSGLLDRFGLTPHADKYPAQLSGGQKQRVGIARALSTGPEILICDEATSALDPETTRSVLSLLADLNRELGLTIVLITHEMDVVRQICDGVAVLDAGRVVEMGPVSKVFLHPAHPVTQRLVREADHVDEPQPGAISRPLHRLTFFETAADQAILGEIARVHGVDYRIHAGRVGTITGRRYAQFTVDIVGPGAAAAVEHFRRAGVTVEALAPDAELRDVA